jgi:hypothetical protein
MAEIGQPNLLNLGKLLWCREGELNPHDRKVGGF